MRNVTEETALLTEGVQFLVDDGLALPLDGEVWIQGFEDGASLFNVQETLAAQDTWILLLEDGFESGDTDAWTSEPRPRSRLLRPGPHSPSGAVRFRSFPSAEPAARMAHRLRLR